LVKFLITNCKAISIPLEVGICFSCTQAENLTLEELSLMASIPYAQAIGYFQWLITYYRFYLDFSVNHLAQFMANLHPWTNLKQKILYLKHICNWGLVYHYFSSTISNYLVLGRTDTNWASDIDTHKSTFDYIFQLNGNLISWQIKKQVVVTLSFIEEKYIATATTTKELMWLQAILAKLGYHVKLPSTLYCDNQSCITLAVKNPKYHERSRHIDIKYHFLHKKVESQVLYLEFTSTTNMWADIIKKSILQTKYIALIYYCSRRFFSLMKGKMVWFINCI